MKDLWYGDRDDNSECVLWFALLHNIARFSDYWLWILKETFFVYLITLIDKTKPTRCQNYNRQSTDVCDSEPPKIMSVHLKIQLTHAWINKQKHSLILVHFIASTPLSPPH